MKIKFNETLQDKNTGAYYYKGTIHEFTDERGAEILASGRAVEEVVEDVAPEATSVDVAPEVTLTEEELKKELEGTGVELVDLETLTVAELKACAKDFGLKTTGTKAQLIERIMAFQMAQN